MESLRNIAIVAHVDHGKTTLVSQLMEQTETSKRTDVSELDNNALERGKRNNYPRQKYSHHLGGYKNKFG